jgi:hypothetical protein
MTGWSRARYLVQAAANSAEPGVGRVDIDRLGDVPGDRRVIEGITLTSPLVEKGLVLHSGGVGAARVDPVAVVGVPSPDVLVVVAVLQTIPPKSARN